MFEPKKFEDIYNDMVVVTQSKIPGVTDFQVGSVIRTIYESFAYEIAVLQEQLNRVYLSSYIDTAEGVELELLVAILGIKRGLPDFAEGIVTFTKDIGTENIEIPLGTILITEETENNPKKAYKTIEIVNFLAEQTEIDVKIQAVERGQDQVIKAETLKIMPLPVVGIKSVINKQGTRFAGKRLETDEELRQRAKNSLISSGKASLIAIYNTLISLPGIKSVKIVERFEENKYGLIDVFVDGMELTPTRKQYLQAQIDQVRSAGVLVRLGSAIPVQTDAVFKLEIDSSAKLTEADRLELEKQVYQKIIDFMNQLEMGEPLLFPQLAKEILSVNSISNLDIYELLTETKNENGIIVRQCYTTQESRLGFTPEMIYKITPKQKLNLEKEYYKIYPRHLSITFDRKLVPLRIEWFLPAIDRSLNETIQNQLTEYINALPLEYTLSRSTLETKIKSIINNPAITNQMDQLSLKVLNSSFLTFVDDPNNIQTIDLSSIESFTLSKENIFIYKNILKITTAISFTSQRDLTTLDKEKIAEKIKTFLTDHINLLHPEESIDLESISQKIIKTIPYISLEWKDEDFRFLVNNQEETALTRIDKKKILVKEFERPQLNFIAISSDLKNIEITISRLQITLTLVSQNYQVTSDKTNIEETHLTLTPEQKTNLQQKLLEDFRKSFLALQISLSNQPGKNLSYSALKTTLVQTIQDSQINNTVTINNSMINELIILGKSLADQRIQVINHSNQEIHVRSIERITSLILSNQSNAITIDFVIN